MLKLKLFSLMLCFNYRYACDLSAIILQNLKNDGFHRNLTYEIDITVHNIEDIGSKNIWQFNDCVMGLVQLLPPGIYANPDELTQLSRSHNLNAVTNNTDVELPAEQSQPNYVFITHKFIDSSFISWVPLHARYQKAKKSGEHVVNEIKMPQLYIQCPNNKLDNCKSTSNSAEFLCKGSSETTCKWKELTHSMISSSPIIWQVPVGDLHHYSLVATVTGTAVVMGSAYLMWNIQKYKFDHD